MNDLRRKFNWGFLFINFKENCSLFNRSHTYLDTSQFGLSFLGIEGSFKWKKETEVHVSSHLILPATTERSHVGRRGGPLKVTVPAARVGDRPQSGPQLFVTRSFSDLVLLTVPPRAGHCPDIRSLYLWIEAWLCHFSLSLLCFQICLSHQFKLNKISLSFSS